MSIVLLDPHCESLLTSCVSVSVGFICMTRAVSVAWAVTVIVGVFAIQVAVLVVVRVIVRVKTWPSWKVLIVALGATVAVRETSKRTPAAS